MTTMAPAYTPTITARTADLLAGMIDFATQQTGYDQHLFTLGTTDAVVFPDVTADALVYRLDLTAENVTYRARSYERSSRPDHRSNTYALTVVIGTGATATEMPVLGPISHHIARNAALAAHQAAPAPASH